MPSFHQTGAFKAGSTKGSCPSASPSSWKVSVSPQTSRAIWGASPQPRAPSLGAGGIPMAPRVAVCCAMPWDSVEKQVTDDTSQQPAEARRHLRGTKKPLFTKKAGPKGRFGTSQLDLQPPQQDSGRGCSSVSPKSPEFQAPPEPPEHSAHPTLFMLAAYKARD